MSLCQYSKTPRERHPNQKAQTPRGASACGFINFRIFVSVVCAARCVRIHRVLRVRDCAWAGWGCAPAQGAGTGVRLAARERHQLSLRLSRWPPHIITQTHVSIIPIRGLRTDPRAADGTKKPTGLNPLYTLLAAYHPRGLTESYSCDRASRWLARRRASSRRAGEETGIGSSVSTSARA